MILTLRTDNPEAEIGLFDGQIQVTYEKWQAHRHLAETIHKKTINILNSQNKTYSDITGIVVYKGPGSYTGLRIGMSVANALAYSNSCTVAATNGDDWIRTGLQIIESGSHQPIALPEYEAPAKTTSPRK